MKKVISLIIIAVVVFAVDYFAVKGIAQDIVLAHRREFLQDWFTGGVLDYIGLSGFNILMALFSIGVVKEPDFVEEVGSSAKGILFFFVLPIVFVALIYIN